MKTISVIFPVLNEEENIPQIIAALESQTLKPVEVFAVDGGSTDNSINLLKEANIEVIGGPKGRGNQIHAALKEVTGDIVFIVHADMKLEETVLAKISKAFENPKTVGGCVGAVFDSKKLKFTLLRWMNTIRVKLTKISFGDQGQFFLREEGIKEGWLKPIPLMEDIELALAMKKAGKTVMLDGGIIASVRRWENKSVFLNALHVSWLLLSYLIKRRFNPNLSAEEFYDKYYGKH